MDDIFSDLKEDKSKEEKDDSNMDWKKSGIDKQERLTLKINVQEANAYDAAKPNNLKKKTKATKVTPNGLKKVRKKIRDIMDEDEDEDENDFILVPVFADTKDHPLKKALTDEEKIQFARQSFTNVRMQENVIREQAIAQAERILKQAGIDKLDRQVADNARLQTVKSNPKEIVREHQKKQLPQKNKPKKVKEQGEKLKSEKEAVVLKTREEKAAARDLRQARAAEAKAEKTLEDVKQRRETKPAEAVKEESALIKQTEEQQLQENTSREREAKEKTDVNATVKETQKTVEEIERQKPQEDMQTKMLILEKSGRSYALPKNEIQKAKREIEKNPEKQKEVEEQMRRYQQQRQQQRNNYGR